MDIINKQEEFSRDNEEWETFRSENELEEEYQLGIEYAKEEGKKEGIEEGIEKVVKSMLDKNIDIKDIVDITGLSEEKILSLKNSN